MIDKASQSRLNSSSRSQTDAILLRFDDSWKLLEESGDVLNSLQKYWLPLFKRYLTSEHFDLHTEILERKGALQKWLYDEPSHSRVLINLTAVSQQNQWLLYVNEIDFDELFNEFTEEIYSESSILNKEDWHALPKNQVTGEEELLRLQMKALINMAPEAILLLDFDKKKYVTANKRAEELFGLSENELLKRHLGELSPKQQPDGKNSRKTSTDYLEDAAAGKEVRFEWKVERADGTLIPVEVRCVRIPDPKRTLLRSSIIDISERKRYERKLKESDAKYRSLFDLHRTAMVYHDYQRKQRHVNQAFRSLFGLESEQTEISEFANWVHSEDIELYKEQRHALRNKQSDGYQLDIRCVTASGSIIYTRMSVSAIRDDKGELIASLRMIEDVTHQREIEQEITQRNEELIKINRELDGFVYTVSHDIRAPLASLKGLIQLVQTETDPETVRNYCRLQEVCIQRLDAFIKDITDYSRNRKTQLKVEGVDVQELLTEIIEQHQYIPTDKGPVKVNVDFQASPRFQTDRSRLNLILNNLISNAIRYADHKKSRPYVNITVVNTVGGGLQIDVADNGLGMREEHLSKIFDMFYRIDSKIEGSGIGLHIVKEATERIKGSIKVESAEGVGTTFFLSLHPIETNKSQIFP